MNYNFIRRGSGQSKDTTITLNRLQQQRALVSGENGGSCAPAGKNDQHVQMSIGRITLCSSKENPRQNWKKNFKKISLVSRAVSSNAHCVFLSSPSSWEPASRSSPAGTVVLGGSECCCPWIHPRAVSS